jgi:hypothetical protein
MPDPPVQASPGFKFALIFVSVVCVGSLVLRVLLPFAFDALSDDQRAVFSLLEWAFTGSFGAVVGLIGGKVSA